jgi:hypothetical protein
MFSSILMSGPVLQLFHAPPLNTWDVTIDMQVTLPEENVVIHITYSWQH